MSLKHKIEAAFESAGSVMTPQGLLHLGNRAAVDQALSRLTREGVLSRIERGVYVARRTSSFGSRLPSVHEVVEQLKLVTGETIVPHGSAEANKLGFTTQVPVRQVYLTSGSSRSLRIGKQQVELKHAHPWELMPGRIGASIRALSTLNRRELSVYARAAVEKLSAQEQRELWERRMQLPQALWEELLPWAVPETLRSGWTA